MARDVINLRILDARVRGKALLGGSIGPEGDEIVRSPSGKADYRWAKEQVSD